MAHMKINQLQLRYKYDFKLLVSLVSWISFQVQKDLPFLHSSDEEQIDYLCQLGTHYISLNNFIRKYGEQALSLQGKTSENDWRANFVITR